MEHIIYQNEKNGYTVLVLTAESEEITCVGMLRGVDEGESLEVRGGFTEHALYGRQFRAESFRVTPPEDVIGMERYLGSGAIRGVGAALAARIIKMFGKDTFRIMEEEPERLAEVKGISIGKNGQGERGAGGGKKGVERCRALSAKIWYFRDICGKDS